MDARAVRERARDGRSRILRRLALAAGVIAVGWFLIGLPAPAGGPLAAELHSSLDMVSAAIALIVGAIVIARYRWTDDAPTLWIGAAMVTLGAVRLVSRLVLPLAGVGVLTTETVAALRFGGRAVASAVLIVGLLRPSGDAVRRLLATLLSSAAVVSLLYWILDLRPDPFADDLDVPLTSAAHFVVAGTLAAVWLVLGSLYLASGLRRGNELVSWFAFSFLVLGLAQILSMEATLVQQLPVLSAAVLRTAGFLCALVGVLTEMRRLYAGQRERLDDMTVALERLETRSREERDTYTHRAHEVRNAVHLIESARSTIQRHRDALSEDDQEHLEHAMRSGVERLLGLFAPEPEERSDGRGSHRASPGPSDH